MNEHDFRFFEPTVVHGGPVDTQVETAASVIIRFRCYNVFEKCDFPISRLAIKLLVHPDLHAEVLIQHIHMDGFKKLPGYIYICFIQDGRCINQYGCSRAYKFRRWNISNFWMKHSSSLRLWNEDTVFHTNWDLPSFGKSVAPSLNNLIGWCILI